jgi:hypothetical protein
MVCGDFRVNGFAVVVVESERGIDVGQGQMREFGYNLVRTHSLTLVHDGDVLNLYSGAGDARLPTARVRCADNVDTLR